MNQDFVQLGTQLRRQREGRALALSHVSRVTKIPERSLVRLEEGKFEELPGDVFIRGFLRSYARCVGLDGEELVRSYYHATKKASDSHPPAIDEDRQDVTEATDPSEPSEPATPAEAKPAPEADPSPTLEMNLLARAIADAGRGTKRISLTFAVIILVIVATLTLSLLLRRPDRHGDGLSAAPVPSETR